MSTWSSKPPRNDTYTFIGVLIIVLLIIVGLAYESGYRVETVLSATPAPTPAQRQSGT